MTTLLEYVCERLMGPPTQRKGNGDSKWPCPNCSHHSFHTMPDVSDHKHRTYCFRCNFRGDVFDVLRFFYPREPFHDRQARLANMTEDYEREVVHGASDTTNHAHPSSLRGSGITDKKVALMWANLSETERVKFAEVAEIADRYDMDIGLVGVLAEYSAGFVAWQAHVSEVWREQDEAEEKHKREVERIKKQIAERRLKVSRPHPIPHKPNSKRGGQQ